MPDLDEASPTFGQLVHFQLEKNNGENNLHGGSNGFDQRVWHAEIKSGHLHDFVTKYSLKDSLPGEQVVGVVFSRTSEDGEEGFPGEVKVEAGYFMTACSDLIMMWKAKLTGGAK